MKLDGLTCSRLNGSSSYILMGPKSVPMSRKVADGRIGGWLGHGLGPARVFKAVLEADVIQDLERVQVRVLIQPFACQGKVKINAGKLQIGIK